VIRSHHVQVHLFDGYWEDIGTIGAFYEANLGLLKPNPPFNLIVPTDPVYSRARFLPPTMVDGATIKHSMIADGCQVGEGAVIENCVLGVRTVIGRDVVLKNSVVMGADFYESAEDRERNDRRQVPHVGVGAGSHIDGAILDKNCRIGAEVRIANESGVEEQGADEEDCIIRDRIPIVIKDAALPDNWKLQ
jgi:glucose-1-phosphate adenylyltransferase